MHTGEFSLITPLLALGFGLLSFLSPCCLPLLPAYLGMIAGSAGSVRERKGRGTLLWNGLAFVAGLSLVFAVLGASASALGLLMLEQRLLVASQEQTVAEGTLLLLFYGFGLGIPFVVAGLAADRALHWSRGARKHLGLIERAGGVVLVAMGVLLFTGQLTLINIWAIRTFGLGLAL